jgi:hypothetical protein
VVGHDTPLRLLDVAPVGSGLVVMDQVVPLRRSTSVLVDVLVVKSPTAKQFVVLGHETPSSSDAVAPVGFGIVATDQLVPLQRCTNAKDEFPTPSLTAKQLVALAQETPVRSSAGGPAGRGFAATDHTAVAPAGSAAPTSTPTINAAVRASPLVALPKAPQLPHWYDRLAESKVIRRPDTVNPFAFSTRFGKRTLSRASWERNVLYRPLTFS